MPYIYKPVRQYMEPNNTVINPKEENNFELIINGQLCEYYKFTIRTMFNETVNSASTAKTVTSKYYPIQSINFTNDIIAINSNDLKNGDGIKFSTDGSLPNPLNTSSTYYVGNFKYGRFNIYTTSSAAIAGGNDYINLTNTGAGNHTVIHNSILYNGEKLVIPLKKNLLTPGEIYKWETTVYAQNLNCSINTSKTSITMAADINNNTIPAISGLSTGDAIVFSTQAGGSLPSPIQAGYTYFWANNKLYYFRTDAFDNTNEIDLTTAGGGTVDVYKNSTEVNCENHNLETGDMIYIEGMSSVGFVANTKYYVRKLTQNTFAVYEYIEGARNDSNRKWFNYNGSRSFIVNNIAESEQIPFYVYDDPDVEFESEEITQQSYTFKPIYNHPQGVMMQSFRCQIRDYLGNIIGDSGLIENSALEYEYSGLRSGTYYNVKFFIYTKVGQEYETSWVAFPVNYAAPNLGITPEATNDPNTSSIIVRWSGLKQVVGEPNGDISFSDNFPPLNNKSLKLGAYAYLTYNNLDIKSGSAPPTFWWSPVNSDFTGVIMRTDNSLTGAYIEVGYNGVNFYTVRNGITYNNAPFTINTGIIYCIGVTESELIINIVGNTNEFLNARK